MKIYPRRSVRLMIQSYQLVKLVSFICDIFSNVSSFSNQGDFFGFFSEVSTNVNSYLTNKDNQDTLYCRTFLQLNNFTREMASKGENRFALN